VKRTPEQLKAHRDYERARYRAMSLEQRRAVNGKKLRAKAERLDATKFEAWQIAVALKVEGKK
jgi:hypothetical protein